MPIFNFKKNILLEAEEDNITVEETDDVDYTEDVEADAPDDTDEETTDDENQDETTDDTEDENTDDTTDETTDDETTDYTADVTDETGEETTDDTGEQPTEEQPAEEAPSEDTIKNAALLRDFIDLYYENINLINKIDGFIDMNYKVNQICVKTKNNLTTLNDYIFDFIEGTFKTNTYVKNLYVYQYALEIVKINIEMFRNISDFNSV